MTVHGGRPLVSIVVPTFNREDLLRLAVTSALRQSVPDLEVVVVNDGGTPVPPFDDDRVRVVNRTESGGAAAARNTGLDEARGTYVTFLDDDDEFVPERLAMGLAGLEKAPIALCWKAGLVSGQIEWSRRLSGMRPDELLSAPVPQLGSALVKRESAVRLDASFSVSEDVEWWIRMSQVGGVHTIPEVGYLIREHAGPRLRDRVRTRLEHRLRILDMHQDFFEEHRGAAAYHWRRAAGLAATVDERTLSARCFYRSFVARPSPRTAASAARNLLGRSS